MKTPYLLVIAFVLISGCSGYGAEPAPPTQDSDSLVHASQPTPPDRDSAVVNELGPGGGMGKTPEEAASSMDLLAMFPSSELGLSREEIESLEPGRSYPLYDLQVEDLRSHRPSKRVGDLVGEDQEKVLQTLEVDGKSKMSMELSKVGTDGWMVEKVGTQGPQIAEAVEREQMRVPDAEIKLLRWYYSDTWFTLLENGGREEMTCISGCLGRIEGRVLSAEEAMREISELIEGNG